MEVVNKIPTASEENMAQLTHDDDDDDGARKENWINPAQWEAYADRERQNWICNNCQAVRSLQEFNYDLDCRCGGRWKRKDA